MGAGRGAGREGMRRGESTSTPLMSFLFCLGEGEADVYKPLPVAGKACSSSARKSSAKAG